jgi:hypothetical protein
VGERQLLGAAVAVHQNYDLKMKHVTKEAVTRIRVEAVAVGVVAAVAVVVAAVKAAAILVLLVLQSRLHLGP